MKLSLTLLFVALASAGLKWLPIAEVAGQRIEANNAGTLILIATLPVLLFANRLRLVLPPALAAILALNALALAAAALTGQDAFLPIAMQSLPATLAAVAVVNLRPNVMDQAGRVVLRSLAVLAGVLAVSSARAGVDLVGGVLTFAAGFDRAGFVFQVIRPLLNAYAGTTDAEYLASVLNEVAASVTLLGFLAISMAFAGRGRMMFTAFLVTCGINLFLFSSAAMLAIAAAIPFVALTVLKSGRSRGVVIATLMVCILCLPFIVDWGATFLLQNTVSDAASRGARLAQYGAAIDAINAAPFSGFGYLSVDGHGIHNLLLFTWTSFGIAGLVLAAMIYGTAFRLMLTGLKGILTRHDPRHLSLAMAILPLLFLTKISFAGAGGFPTGSGLLALALALLADRRLGEGRSLRPHPHHRSIPCPTS